MTAGEIIPPRVSLFVPKQFPPQYELDDPLFIAFLQAYFQWMESQGQPLYYTRGFLDFQNVDETTDQFLVLIKEKFLKNIQLDTQSNIRQLIKHATDIYRSKGSERCTDLLFRLVFNEAIKFYYPKDDLFRLSDGVWYQPKYLELSLSYFNRQLHNKKIIGNQSGATAFIDSLIRRSYDDHLIDLAYISSIEGTFIVGEKIQAVDNTLTIEQCPTICGSLTAITIDVTGTGADFVVGDLVDIQSESGLFAKGRIASIVSKTGLVTPIVDEGGYAYTSTSNVFVSNAILQVAITGQSNNYARQYFQLFDQFTQPQAIITYTQANGNFSVGDYIFTYFGNNSVKGQGQILTLTPSNSTAGQIFASVLSGDLNATPFYNTANAVTANGTSYTNATATGTFFAVDDISVTVSNTSGFVIGEDVVQYNEAFDNVYPIAIATCISRGGNQLSLANVQGTFLTNRQLWGVTSGSHSNTTNVVMTVGLFDVSNTFNSTPNNYFTCPSVSGTVTISGTYNLSLSVVNSFTYSETVNINTDLIKDYANVLISANTYGFPANTSANASSKIANTMTFVPTVIGKITTVLSTSFNQQIATLVPLVKIYESKTYSNRYDYDIVIANQVGTFIAGEVITQTATNARGLITDNELSDNCLFVQNLRYYQNNDFIATTNSTTTIVGSSSGATANVVSVSFNRQIPHMGYNANVEVQATTSNGSIFEIQVFNSGFGYINDQEVTISKDDTSNNYKSGVGFAVTSAVGIGSGFYKQKGGFLSDSKKLFDGFYWQEFSYEIISSKMLDKYKDLVKNLSHVAGVMLFGRLVHTQENIPSNILVDFTDIGTIIPNLLTPTLPGRALTTRAGQLTSAANNILLTMVGAGSTAGSGNTRSGDTKTLTGVSGTSGIGSLTSSARLQVTLTGAKVTANNATVTVTKPGAPGIFGITSQLNPGTGMTIPNVKNTIIGANVVVQAGNVVVGWTDSGWINDGWVS